MTSTDSLHVPVPTAFQSVTILLRPHAGYTIYRAAQDAIDYVRKSKIQAPEIALEFNTLVLRIGPESTPETLELDYYQQLAARQGR